MQEEEKSDRWAIVVEAPHVCVWPEVADPPCDMRTDDFARRLHSRLQELREEKEEEREEEKEREQREKGDFDLYLLESDQPRSRCDHNRPQCFNEPYRQRLRKIVAQYAPRAYVIDVHSFEDGYDWISPRGAKQRNLPLQKRPDIVFLDSDADREEPESTARTYTQHLARDLRENTTVWRASEHLMRVKWLGLFPGDETKREIHVEKSAPLVYVLAGSRQNDIMIEMREQFHCKSILIEFLQALTGPSLDAIVDQLAKTIVADLRGKEE